MAFIPGYTYDIFISYAHVDNIAFPGQGDGWIKQFYENLNLLLARRCGRLGMINFWWDSKKLDGSVVFDNSIEEGIKRSAIMICLNSQGYIASDYCQQEMKTFYKKAQNEKPGLNVGNRSRIINVLLNNIPFEQWPTELAGTSGFHFHDAKENEDLGDPFETLAPKFKERMQDLRDAVWTLLNDFQKVSTEVPAQQKNLVEQKENSFCIYLGEVADTLRTAKKRLIVELEKKGFSILSGVPPPDEVAVHDEAASKAIQKADLSIHLLDAFAGREIPDAQETWYPQRQVELALNTEKSQMIWMPAETDFATVEEEKYAIFLQGLETGKVSSKSYEFVRGSKATLPQEIIEFALEVQAKQKQKAVPKERISVLLDTHFKDQEFAFDLSKALLRNDIQPYVNPQEDDPRKNISLMGDRLSQVKKLIFLYGGVSKDWVLERMSAALQLIITNNYPIEDFFIFMAPPRKEESDIKLNQRFLKVNVINGSTTESMEKMDLQQFLEAIKTSAA